jgi:hypothetical protein
VYDRIAAQPQATPAFSTVASLLTSPAQTDGMAKLALAALWPPYNKLRSNQHEGDNLSC